MYKGASMYISKKLMRVIVKVDKNIKNLYNFIKSHA